MYGQVHVNDKDVMAMIDTSVTHNFLANREIQKLGLSLTQHSSRIRAVNSEAKPIQGVVSVELKPHQGKCSLMVIPLDDFDVILGIDSYCWLKRRVSRVEETFRWFVVGKVVPTVQGSIWFPDSVPKKSKMGQENVWITEC
ncbi:UNVERIFIED_CONTAM: hypothetical protein Slati_2166100 [Sesamum latifolium]|uniref:Uncharacterized protein n=1 Tax=Sesamum latifolium TaxID=2727402 RepID=A0AAW2WTY9_9LAMI